ncbi:ATP-binding protein [bacterium]|nr:ATP-binding protein [bacterium]
MFKRWIEIDPNKSALIIGPRRSGKTTYLKDAFPEYAYATLDDFDAFDWAERDPKGFITSLGKHCIIDEIQRVPKLTIAVKYAIDNENAHILMTGSSSIGLLDASADTLAGRINQYSMTTACWGESISKPLHSIFHEKASVPTIKEGMRTFREVATYGLFPEVVTSQSSDEKKKILRNYRDTYFTKDLMQMGNIENLSGLNAIFSNICRSIGSHLEVSNFARESSLSVPSTKKYLNTLEQSELTFKLYGYQYGPAKRYIKAAKTYFSDNGIIESFHVRISEGQLIENFVISELEKRRKLGLIKADRFYYYKSSAGREIDLVFEEDQCLNAVEIKAIKSPSGKDLSNLKEFINQSNRKVKGFLFYLGEDYQEIEGITLIPIYSLFCGK